MIVRDWRDGEGFPTRLLISIPVKAPIHYSPVAGRLDDPEILSAVRPISLWFRQ
jgi:hypothetical protein